MSGRHKKAPKDGFYRELGRAIRVARVAAGKSQADIAEHIDVSTQQVQKYEKGINRIPVRELFSLADFLEVPLTDLTGSSRADAHFKSLAEKFSVKGFHTLLESWGAIKDQPMRAAILEVIRRAADLSRR